MGGDFIGVLLGLVTAFLLIAAPAISDNRRKQNGDKR